MGWRMPDAAPAYHLSLRPHRWQRRVIQSSAREVAAIAGIRGGKTVIGSLKFLANITAAPPGVALMTGPDLPTIKQTALETILHGMGPSRHGRWPGCIACGEHFCVPRQQAKAQGWPWRECDTPRETPGKYSSLVQHHNRSDHILHLRTGHRVLYRGAENPDDLRGPAAVAYWCDEVTLCRPDVLPVLQGRTLDTGGHGIVTGTPKGRNWFWQTVLQGCREVIPGRVWQSDRWEIVSYPTRENPAIDAAALASLGASYSAKMRAQELEAEFVDWGGVVFPSEAITAGVERGSPHWRQPAAGHRIVIGVDPAGRGKDWWAVIVLCATCRGVIDVWREQRLAAFRPVYLRCAQAAHVYRAETLVIDETALGGQSICEEVEYEVRRLAPHCAVEGFVFTSRSKAELLSTAISRIEEIVGLPQEEAGVPLVNELRAYEWADKALTTDCVMAFALACRPLSPLGVEIPAPQARNLTAMPRPALDRAAMP